MKFRIQEVDSPIAGQLTYDKQEYAFATEPRPTGCTASVSVNELELMIDQDNGRVVFVTGYSPYSGWKPAKLRPAVGKPGGLYVDLDKNYPAGMSISIHPEDERWPVLADESSGWVRFGKGDPERDGDGVEFAPASIVIVRGDKLIALWLHPARFPKHS